MFSTDDDFLEIATRWIRSVREFPGLVYGKQSGITIGGAVRDLELIAKVFEPQNMRNQILWLPL